MMTREDVLRELELLPVWQLRSPFKIAEPTAEKAPIEEVATKAAAENTSLELIISDDKKWIFAYPADRMAIGSQGMLFKNILFALKVEKTTLMPLAQLATVDAKVIIAMGESAAQQLLNTQEPLEALRGKPHSLHNIPLIVTYHPNDCLQHLPNKAKTWDDLCTALSIMKA